MSPAAPAPKPADLQVTQADRTVDRKVAAPEDVAYEAEAGANRIAFFGPPDLDLQVVAEETKTQTTWTVVRADGSPFTVPLDPNDPDGEQQGFAVVESK